jgi:FPC/CPF motif-containing protein YcgG
MSIHIEDEQNLDKTQNLKLVSVDRKDREQIIEAQNIQNKLEDFILKNDHPCLMAKSVFDSGRYLFGMYQELGNPENASQIHKDLHEFLDLNKESSPQQFSSYVAVFKSSVESSEEAFERKLWQQLQHLHEEDAPLYPWDPKVSSDSSDPHFSFSLLGHAFFLIGLHPNSSRLARKFQYQAMVFNLHEQFEILREMKSFDIVSEKIRTRDQELQGSINPMLAHYGEISEARQYSGRKVEDNWKCPFHKSNI